MPDDPHTLVKLLTFDIVIVQPRILRDDEEVLNLIYGLDDYEFMRIVRRDEHPEDVPPDFIMCPTTGLPLRPLYFNLTDGMSRRATPKSWMYGIPYKI